MNATLAEDAWSLAFGTLSLDDGMAMREGTAWRLMPRLRAISTGRVAPLTMLIIAIDCEWVSVGHPRERI